MRSEYEMAQQQTHRFIIKCAVAGVSLLALTIGGCLAAGPQYKVYRQRLAGEAELAQANYSKQVAVQEALATKDSARYKAEAQIIAAGGIARSNQIIGTSLKNNPDYLTYLWIEMMQGTKNQVIYVPTEAGVPVTEAGRFAPRHVTVDNIDSK
jgi:hypothetical protein